MIQEKVEVNMGQEKVQEPKKLRKRRLPSGLLVTPARFEELVERAFHDPPPLAEKVINQEVNYTLGVVASELEKWLTVQLRMAPGYVRMMKEIVNKHKR